MTTLRPPRRRLLDEATVAVVILYAIVGLAIIGAAALAVWIGDALS